MAARKTRAKKTAKANDGTGANVGYEAPLWQMADGLPGAMDAAEYRHIVLGLTFLKYISDAFEEQRAKLRKESNSTTLRLAKMNLAIRGIDREIGHCDTFHNHRRPDLQAAFILANRSMSPSGCWASR